jgi:hypothetical protein
MPPTPKRKLEEVSKQKLTKEESLKQEEQEPAAANPVASPSSAKQAETKKSSGLQALVKAAILLPLPKQEEDMKPPQPKRARLSLPTVDDAAGTSSPKPPSATPPPPRRVPSPFNSPVPVAVASPTTAQVHTSPESYRVVLPSTCAAKNTLRSLLLGIFSAVLAVFRWTVSLTLSSLSVYWSLFYEIPLETLVFTVVVIISGWLVIADRILYDSFLHLNAATRTRIVDKVWHRVVKDVEKDNRVREESSHDI